MGTIKAHRREATVVSLGVCVIFKFSMYILILSRVSYKLDLKVYFEEIRIFLLKAELVNR